QRCDIAGGYVARVELDRELGLTGCFEREMVAQHIHRLDELGRGQEVRRPATEVHLHDATVAVEERREQRDLTIEAGEVGCGAGPGARGDVGASRGEAAGWGE